MHASTTTPPTAPPTITPILLDLPALGTGVIVADTAEDDEVVADGVDVKVEIKVMKVVAVGPLTCDDESGPVVSFTTEILNFPLVTTS